MKINKYQIYLTLFFIIFLSADACFIFIANATYGKKLSFDNLKNIYSKTINNVQADNENPPKISKIDIKPLNKQNDFIIFLKLDKTLHFKRLAVRIYNAEDRMAVKNFIFDFTKQNLYRIKLNASNCKRCVLKINLRDNLNHQYFSAYRMIFDKANYRIIQIN
ncbi:hypothetical protein N3Z17_06855 [Candidatus Bandiella numerosa]|jgi:hypothetical protein|uniref:hypothetical protein n=1 Tax=Candidatus Bandiella numerosa TaxID=2570586 RepID=UPI00249E2B5A|nr:hypothetical protein [Candidatus Bandiella numerosa]WHA04933.1 hypothetical protein N3Z17_06855 [Candidatus Bandiella numerosa]